MKKLFVVLLPLCLSATRMQAQDIHITDPGNGMQYTNPNSPLPLLDDLTKDREDRYTLLDNSEISVGPERSNGKSTYELFYKRKWATPNKELINTTPYLPIRKSGPALYETNMHKG
jgi:hypothetical protein